jgi:hypothetical protein
VTAPDIYADYIKTLADAEGARKSSLEQRGVGIATTSATLATLLFALVGVTAKNFILPQAPRPYLAASVILFAVAVAIGLAANLPFLYQEAAPTPDELVQAWNYTEQEAQAYVIATRLSILASARRANGMKGWLVLIGGIIQLTALLMLVVAVLTILH